MKYEANFFGKDGFFWWIGVVEDRRDPLKLGRLRVRILGAHTEVKSLIPTKDLHWAYVYQPITSQAMNGLGHSPTGPAEGTWCWGMFKDGDSGQDPVVLGTIGGIPQTGSSPCVGFFDPSQPFHDLPNAPRKIFSRFYPNDGTGAQLKSEHIGKTYARTSHPWGCEVGEPDTNRLARAEKVDDTIIGVRKRQRDVNVPIAFAHTKPGRKWDEPKSTYAAQYPYNHVYESESGHVFEIDDTPGAERLHFYHRSGTFVEIQGGTDGDFVLKCVGKRFEVTMEQAYSHFQNTMNVTVDGETNIYCRSNANLQVDGDMNVHVRGNYTEKIHGDYLTDIDGNRVVKIRGNDELDVQKNRSEFVKGNSSADISGSRIAKVGSNDEADVGGNHAMKAKGSETQHCGGSLSQAAGGALRQSAAGSFKMAAGGELSADAPNVFWNSGMGSTEHPSSPSKPASAKTPSVPDFPSPLNKWTESRSDSGGSAPTKETKADPEPPQCSNQKGS